MRNTKHRESKQCAVLSRQETVNLLSRRYTAHIVAVHSIEQIVSKFFGHKTAGFSF